MLHSCELPGHWLAIQTVTTCNTELRHAAHSPLPSPTPDPSQMACKSFEIKHHSMMKHTLTPVAELKDRKARDLKNMREHKRKCKKRRQGFRSRVQGLAYGLGFTAYNFVSYQINHAGHIKYEWHCVNLCNKHTVTAARSHHIPNNATYNQIAHPNDYYIVQ